MAAKSYWSPVACSTDRDRENIRSWFQGMADGWTGPTKASLLARVADDREIKIAAIFTKPDGTPKELVRTVGSRFTITVRAPTVAPWR